MSRECVNVKDAAAKLARYTGLSVESYMANTLAGFARFLEQADYIVVAPDNPAYDRVLMVLDKEGE